LLVHLFAYKQQFFSVSFPFTPPFAASLVSLVRFSTLIPPKYVIFLDSNPTFSCPVVLIPVVRPRSKSLELAIRWYTSKFLEGVGVFVFFWWGYLMWAVRPPPLLYTFRLFFPVRPSLFLTPDSSPPSTLPFNALLTIVPPAFFLVPSRTHSFPRHAVPSWFNSNRLYNSPLPKPFLFPPSSRGRLPAIPSPLAFFVVLLALEGYFKLFFPDELK